MLKMLDDALYAKYVFAWQGAGLSHDDEAYLAFILRSK
jgi:hypothetical protein